MHYLTKATAGGRRSDIVAASPGCLCRVDGAVPSKKSGTDIHGRPVSTIEEWQQGAAVVTYEVNGPGHHIDLIYIRKGQTVCWGKRIEC